MHGNASFFESLYLPNAKRYRLPIFEVHTTPFLYNKINDILESCSCSTPVLQRPIPDRVITLGRSNQIASRFVGTEVLYIPIDLYCCWFLCHPLRRYVIQLNNVCALFPARFAPIIWDVISLARIEREKVHQLYLRNGWNKN